MGVNGKKEKSHVMKKSRQTQTELTFNLLLEMRADDEPNHEGGEQGEAQ